MQKERTVIMFVGKNFNGVNAQLKPKKTVEIKDTPKQAEGQTKCGAVWRGTGTLSSGYWCDMFSIREGDVVIFDDGAYKVIGFENSSPRFEKCEVHNDDYESDRGDYRSKS